MSEKLSKIILTLEMIFLAIPLALTLVFSDIIMIGSFVTERDEVESILGFVLILTILGLCTVAMYSYFYLTLKFLKKGRGYSQEYKGVNFYIVEVTCLLVALAFLIKEIPGIPPVVGLASISFSVGIPMVATSIHVLLEYGLRKQLTSVFKSDK
jgi:hypothetical protein